MKPELREQLDRLTAYGPLAMALDALPYYATAEQIEARVDPRTERAIAARDGAIALIPVRGVIIPRARADSARFNEVGAENLATAVEAAVADKRVKAIILDVDSPGGNVFGVQEAATRINAARGRKPIVAHADFLMASAAYWLAVATDEVIMSPSALVGSVGVISAHVDISAMLDSFGVKISVMSEPDAKRDGNPFEPLSERARASTMERIGAVYDGFAGFVAERRGVDMASVRADYAGVYTSKRAMKLGMVDKVRSMPDSVGAYVPVAPNAPVARLQRQIDLCRLKAE